MLVELYRSMAEELRIQHHMTTTLLLFQASHPRFCALRSRERYSQSDFLLPRSGIAKKELVLGTAKEDDVCNLTKPTKSTGSSKVRDRRFQCEVSKAMLYRSEMIDVQSGHYLSNGPTSPDPERFEEIVKETPTPILSKSVFLSISQ